MALDVVAPHTDRRVDLAGFRVLIRVEARVGFVLAAGGVQALEQLQRVSPHLSFVVFYPAYHSAVGVEAVRAVGAKLLLVDPVGQAVDNLIELAISGNLALSVVVE